MSRRVPRPVKVLTALAVGLAAVGATAGATLGAVGAVSDGPHGGPPGRGHHGDRGVPGPDRVPDGVGGAPGAGR